MPVEESQQPTWPHDWHSRRATQKVPSVRHSSQASGVFCGGKLSGVRPAKCSHELAMISSDLKCQQAVEKASPPDQFRISKFEFRIFPTTRLASAAFEQPESEFFNTVSLFAFRKSPRFLRIVIRNDVVVGSIPLDSRWSESPTSCHSIRQAQSARQSRKISSRRILTHRDLAFTGCN